MNIDKQAIIQGYIDSLIYNSITYNGDLPREFIDNSVSGQMRAHAQDEVELFLEKAGRRAFLAEHPELAGQLIVIDRNGAAGGFADHDQYAMENIAEKMAPVYLSVNHNDELVACFY